MHGRKKNIALYDSGVGGLSVFQALHELLPNENILYFADNANSSYGDKSEEEILALSLETLHFLNSLDVKLAVIACHTISAIALSMLQATFTLPILGIIEPSLQSLSQIPDQSTLAILATHATIASGVYQNKLARHALIPVACPLFAPYVESASDVDSPCITPMVHRQLKSLKGKTIDIVLLACTHYTFLSEHIKREIGKELLMIDPARNFAQIISSWLHEKNLANLEKSPGKRNFFVSGDPGRFSHRASQLLNRAIGPIQTKKRENIPNK